MSPPLSGIDDDVARIEEWNLSCLAHEAVAEAKRPQPEISEHPNGQKSTKQEAFVRDAPRQSKMGCSVAAQERCAGVEEYSKRKVRIQRSISASSLSAAIPLRPTEIGHHSPRASVT
jgi:hypothetical protein